MIDIRQDYRDLYSALRDAQRERDELKGLLNAAKCPQCNGGGAYYDQYGEVCQCQWCHESLKHKDSTAELQAKAVEDAVESLDDDCDDIARTIEELYAYAATLRNQAEEEVK